MSNYTTAWLNNPNDWLSMHLFPKDGTACFLLFKDRSGMLVGFWGECADDGELGVFDIVDNEFVGPDLDGDAGYAGWLPCPIELARYWRARVAITI
jgi:hypothetical protein